MIKYHFYKQIYKETKFSVVSVVKVNIEKYKKKKFNLKKLSILLYEFKKNKKRQRPF